MKLKLNEDVLNARAIASDGAPFHYSGEGDEDVCCIGIEHHLTPACTLGVRDYRVRWVTLRARKLGNLHVISSQSSYRNSPAGQVTCNKISA